jgi:type II secretory pathway component PulF
MLFKYSALDQKGNKNQGSIDAISLEVAISSLQKRGLIISSINPADKGSFFDGGT